MPGKKMTGKMSKEKIREILSRRSSSATSPQDRKHELTDEEAIKEQLEDDVPCASDYCCGGKNVSS